MNIPFEIITQISKAYGVRRKRSLVYWPVAVMQWVLYESAVLVQRRVYITFKIKHWKALKTGLKVSLKYTKALFSKLFLINSYPYMQESVCYFAISYFFFLEFIFMFIIPILSSFNSTAAILVIPHILLVVNSSHLLHAPFTLTNLHST